MLLMYIINGQLIYCLTKKLQIEKQFHIQKIFTCFSSKNINHKIQRPTNILLLYYCSVSKLKKQNKQEKKSSQHYNLDM